MEKAVMELGATLQFRLRQRRSVFEVPTNTVTGLAEMSDLNLNRALPTHPDNTSTIKSFSPNALLLGKNIY